MANITQNGINFTVETGGLTHAGWDKKYTNAMNILGGVYDPDLDDIEKSINAVEIDWNGADLYGATGKWPASGEYIKTTGQLLAAFRFAYNHNN